MTVGTIAPGALAARRGRYSSRPGDPDYPLMQALDVSETLRAHPLSRLLFGADVEVRLHLAEGGRCLRFELRAAAPSSASAEGLEASAPTAQRLESL